MFGVVVVVVAIVGLALVLLSRPSRRRPVTEQQLEHRRRQLGIHDGKGNSFVDPH